MTTGSELGDTALQAGSSSISTSPSAISSASLAIGVIGNLSEFGCIVRGLDSFICAGRFGSVQQACLFVLPLGSDFGSSFVAAGLEQPRGGCANDGQHSSNPDRIQRGANLDRRHVRLSSNAASGFSGSGSIQKCWPSL
jgi:hypothetical protein